MWPAQPISKCWICVERKCSETAPKARRAHNHRGRACDVDGFYEISCRACIGGRGMKVRYYRSGTSAREKNSLRSPPAILSQQLQPRLSRVTQHFPSFFHPASSHHPAILHKPSALLIRRSAISRSRLHTLSHTVPTKKDSSCLTVATEALAAAEATVPATDIQMGTSQRTAAVMINQGFHTGTLLGLSPRWIPGRPCLSSRRPTAHLIHIPLSTAERILGMRVVFSQDHALTYPQDHDSN